MTAAGATNGTGHKDPARVSAVLEVSRALNISAYVKAGFQRTRTGGYLEMGGSLGKMALHVDELSFKSLCCFDFQNLCKTIHARRNKVFLENGYQLTFTPSHVTS
jgi:hypothetical protein